MIPKEVRVLNVNTSLEIKTDKNLFMQILYNLLINALKYSIENVKPTIEIELIKDHSYFYLQIKDYGRGISEKYKENFFYLGFRGDNAKKIKGKGFGLWISKKLLENLGMEIQIANYKNPTIFEIRIPNELITKRKIMEVL